MFQLRFWLAALIGWLIFASNLNRIVSSEISASATATAVLIAIFTILFLRAGDRKRLAVYALAAACPLVVRLFVGDGFSVAGFGVAIVEVGVVAVAILLTDMILHCTGTVDRVMEEAVTIQLGAELLEIGRGESGVQAEMARARRFERPLTVVAVSAIGRRTQQELHQVLQKAQREVIDRYVEGRLHRLLTAEVRDCDIVARQNGQFVILMPETDREFAQTIVDRVQEAASDEIGLTVKAGIAAFPDEECTLVGLLDRASSEMGANPASPAPRTPK